MRDLVSKVLAGGLSGALFLFWWPAAVPGEGAEWLVVRGLLWALAFEVLLLAFCPLERAVAGAVRSRRIQGLTVGQGARALTLAAAGLAVPFALLDGTEARPDPVRAAAPKERVIVKREIVRREVVVKRVSKVVPVTVAANPAPPATSAGARASTGSSSAGEAARSKSVKRSALVVERPATKRTSTTAPGAGGTTSTPASINTTAPATKTTAAGGAAQPATASGSAAPAATSSAATPAAAPPAG
jgi:hypothetical protein